MRVFNCNTAICTAMREDPGFNLSESRLSGSLDTTLLSSHFATFPNVVRKQGGKRAC